MNDPWNPSHDDLVAWAYESGASEPVQDWDLALAHERHVGSYLEIAADDSCPNRTYFLHVLYLIVGDAVRSNYRSLAALLLQGDIEMGDAFTHPDIKLWQQRSHLLIRRPELFEYGAWCGGGLARNSAPWPGP